MKINFLAVLSALSLAAAFLPVLSCSANSGVFAAVRDAGSPMAQAKFGAGGDYGETGAGAGISSADTENAETPIMERRLVRRANLRIRVKDTDEADRGIAALMEHFGAYSESTETGDSARFFYVIRVPERNYGAFLAALEGMGRVLRRGENVEDVTLRYSDLEGRLATKQELLKTYQSYLGRAKNIEEILSVEARIATLQNEIDQTGKDLRYLASQVNYATVSLDIQGPAPAKPFAGPGLGERIGGLFSRFGEFAATALTVLIGLVIYGIPAVLVLALVFWICFGKIGLIKKLWRAVSGKK